MLVLVLKVTAVLVAVRLLVRWLRRPRSNNPFASDARQSVRPLVIDQKARDRVIKQSFSPDRVPADLDAIVIGSGIGGLSVAAIMAKAGKKVLVLEQHDQAGGCCHTFIDKGYEFDVGIHYIGNLNSQTSAKTLIDQLTHGQLQWAALDDEFDTAVFGDKRYSLVSGRRRWLEHVKKQFPDDTDAVDRLFEAVVKCKKGAMGMVLVKMLPVWLSQLLLQTGLFNLVSDVFKWNKRSVQEVVTAETNNKDLQALFMYCFGDYGTSPDQAGFPMQATLLAHFWHGGSYPVGGASEIAFHMIPVIEEAGGRVLVRAEVKELLMDELRSTVVGVKVAKGSSTHEIRVPMVISNGCTIRLQRLLPRPVAETSRLWPLTKMSHATAGFSVFVGLNAPLEEIRGSGDSTISPRNWWVFTNNDITKVCNDYMALSADEALDRDVPLMFISFPSTKDPEWEKRYPGKTTMAIVTLANYDWFKQWENERCTKRGADYEGVKNTIGDKLVAQATRLFPQIRDHIDYVSFGSPVTNNFYLGAPRGEMYGMDHNQERFSGESQTLLRPATDVPGLYLTGQDILSCGFSGGLYGGVLAASVVLGRNCFSDVETLHKQLKKAA
ncbi:all-trans-retinol 13,14-reductase-like [Pollicipes pollicipes]|uniref:all-trans-retinol 13,14-reductase-like n=1 Tax=Pollicipes pollicipes TaxID=41117 RepID=UPI001884FD08|nr:all-trans-retinol 13,14-reductase-like [Pollicipes pollicipes]